MLAVTGAAFLIIRQHHLITCLRAIIESFERPVLFYDRHDHLTFHSSGLIFFKKESLKAIAHLEERPAAGQTFSGEMIIDFNRYRYRSNSLEYKPGKVGTIVFLEYQGSVAAR
jgi:hypothetical protein